MARCFVAISLFCMASLNGSADAQDARPNVVIIMADDLGFSDIGCYGGEIDTPHLDRLAANGLRFTDFHNNAKCSETRAAMLTGLWHHQSKNLKQPGHVTIAEVLRDAGYTTLMSGKWHVNGTPWERGFERYFGFLGGAIDYYTGLDWGNQENLMRLDGEEFEAPEGFYATDAITDYALTFLDEEVTEDKPFFLYLAYNAPHFPLQAPTEDLDKYEDRYREGWDVIRQRRIEKLEELGIIDPSWRPAPRDSRVEAWDDLSEESREFLRPMMVAYAAMVDRLDQNVGRIVDYLDQKGELDNTLILFLSDNGACPYARERSEGVRVGLPESDIGYGARWASMCNTPLRLYKQYAHEGGTTTPFIAHWPKGIEARGGFSQATTHLVDLMPTLLELGNADYPRMLDGQAIMRMEGESFVAALKGGSFSRTRPIYWEFGGNHAVRVGDWKLVAERSKDWELYDLSKDRCETNDLAAKMPETVEALASDYDAWAKRAGAKTHARAMEQQPNSQRQLFELK